MSIVDATETTTEKVIETIFFNIVSKQIAPKIISSIPFLGWPVINPVFMFILSSLAKVFYEELSRGIKMMTIDYEVEKEKQAYIDALKKLEDELAKPKESKDETAIERERLNTRDRLRDLIRISH